MLQSVLFPHLDRKDIEVCFDEQASSSDGGSVLLKACDHALGLTETLAASLDDPRQPGKITHTFPELLRQRVFGLALGYADCNDAARLKDDPMLKLLPGRGPRDGADLASQPTLSRFENQVTWRDLARMGEALARAVIERQRRRRKTARRITLDFDPTCDPTPGNQQLSLFNAFYDTYGYLPIVGCLSFD